MSRLLVAASVVLFACKSDKREPPRPERTSGSAAPAPATGSAGLDETALDALLRDVDDYTLKLTDLWIEPEVSCDEMAKRFLALEPLVTKVRERWLAVVAKAPDVAAAEQTIRDRIRARKPVMMPKIEARLAEHGMVPADLDKREASLQARCGSHAELAAARDRVGLFQRK